MRLQRTVATGGSRPIAFGHHQPDRVVDNAEMAKIVETSDEWIRSRTGIVTRRVGGDDDTVPEMARRAACHAMATGDLDPASVDLVIVATMTAEHRSPNVAGMVSAAIGTSGAAVMDINVACSGFVHALAVADMAIRCGSSTRALVIGSERMTAFTDMTDRSTCVLTADGAGAVVLDASTEPCVGPVAWGSTPEMVQAVRIQPPSNLFAQDGRAVYRWALTHGAANARRAIELAEVDPDRIEVLVTHQANLRIIEPLGTQLGMSERIVVTDVVESGNTSAASIPLGLSKWWHAGRIPSNALALLFGFGGGFAFASTVIRTPERS
ncbi:MAG: beta-ketoacyl-ACP synthase 3 [Ilumatobacteraceae bacterium]